MEHHGFVIEKEQLLPWLEELRKELRLIGPVDQEGGPAFVEVDSVDDMNLDYGLTMMGPQVFIYQPVEKMCSIVEKDGSFAVEMPQAASAQVLFGVRSCDLHAIVVLDRAFIRRETKDLNYRRWRENTVVIGLHCLHVYRECFCASMGTGPLYNVQEGYDLLFTDLDDVYLTETLGERALRLLSPLRLRPATDEHFEKKRQVGLKLEAQFKKKLDTTHVVESILGNQDHPVWAGTADQRCLSCTNCTMVCPTCFCYNVKDTISFDMRRCERLRYKDSCQELHFAEVHGGNLRATRMARLRQFVTHKLATWWEQFGCFGCVGCGRCMTWCPTKIDLTVMAAEIMATEKSEALRKAEG